jgi:cytochrome c-type biogenesis protein
MDTMSSAGAVFAAGFGATGPALALTAGVITAFNPCGFAMLPAYVSYFVGSDAKNGPAPAPLIGRLRRATVTGLLVTAGFVTVYGIIGAIATQFLSRINSVVPFISMGVGVVLALLGVAMLRGYEPKISWLTVKQSRKGNGAFSMYAYGVVYAIVSLSCGFAGFTTAVVSAFQEESFAASMRVYLAFAAGMGLVLLVLSYAVALAQQGFVRGMRKVLPYVHRVSGGLLVLAGLYVAYYGWYSWQTVQRGNDAPAGPVAWVEDWSLSIQRAVDGRSTSFYVALLVVLGGCIAAVFALTQRRREPASAQPLASVPDPSAPTPSAR